MEWIVYMLHCADGTYYTGITNDVEKRLKAHNELKTGAKYTRARRPVRLAYQECLPTRGEALRREHALKQLTHLQKKLLATAILHP